MPRKLVKVVKKLKKFWPGKKRKKQQPPVIWIKEQQQLEYYHLPPPPPPYDFHFTCSSSAFQPSAPPLPPWFDLEPEPEPEPDLDQTKDESVLLSTTSSSSYHMSYQQYAVPTPVYEVPAAAQPKGRRQRGGFFGYVVGFVINVFGCFCPCLRITEVR